MRLSKGWLLWPALLKHKAFVCLHRNESRAGRCDSVGNGEAVGSVFAVGLAFVFVDTQCYHESYAFASGFGTET